MDWAVAEVELWPDDVRGAEPDWAALEGMARRDAATVRRLTGVAEAVGDAVDGEQEHAG